MVDRAIAKLTPNPLGVRPRPDSKMKGPRKEPQISFRGG